MQLVDAMFGCDGRFCTPDIAPPVTIATGRHVTWFDGPDVHSDFRQIEVFPQRRLEVDDRDGLTEQDTHVVVLGTNPEGTCDNVWSYLTLAQARATIAALERAVRECDIDAARLDRK